MKTFVFNWKNREFRINITPTRCICFTAEANDRNKVISFTPLSIGHYYNPDEDDDYESAYYVVVFNVVVWFIKWKRADG